MTKSELITLLETPTKISPENGKDLRELVSEYPYFQSLRCIYLKHLFDQQSFLYNTELKEVAVHTPSREVLFDFITSKEFSADEIAKKNEWNFNTDEENFGLSKEEIEKISTVENLIEQKKDTTKSIDTNQGKPLEFSKSDRYSFNEWLQLTKTSKLETSEETSKGDKVEEKNKNIDKIDLFLANNPKISRPSESSTNKEITLRTKPSSEFMTETLARVYEEQRKYDKAIQAYNILILNNPEKSSFFADQIKRIEQIIENNK